ncbi:restriction endonuclease subunit S [Glutamicibacter ardleyensis]|uniref:restriction endonuclease subunit S n=1 Tax=Glutamicibacter ardleyensis TaxID=225894 RepID=UPI003FD1E8E9
MKLTLDTTCSIIVDCEHKTAPIDEYGEYFAVGTPAMRGNVIDYDQARRISKHTFELWTRRLVPLEGDLLFAREAPVGPIVLIPNSGNVAPGQRTVLMRPNPDIVDSRFLYYLLSSPLQQNRIQALAAGSTVAHLNVADIRSFEINVPKLEVQRAIARVLGALDDKIATNTKMASIAEDLLQASYQGLISRNPTLPVRVDSLVQRISPPRKFDKKELVAQGSFPVFDQSESGFLGYLNGEGFINASSEAPVLYFGDHTCKLRVAAQKFTVGPNTVPFVGLSMPSLTLYCALNGIQKHEEYKRHWQLLMQREIYVPEAKKADEFALRHRNLLELSETSVKETQLLVAIRDSLLPQLMSGMLHVKDAEDMVETVL